MANIMKGWTRRVLLGAMAALVAASAATAAPAAASIEETVRSYWSALSAMEPEKALALFADGAESIDPWGAPPVVGTEARRQAYAGLSGAFRGVTFSVVRLKITGDRAAVAWTADATTADGRRVSFDGIDVFEFDEDAMITRQWGYWDPTILMPPRSD